MQKAAAEAFLLHNFITSSGNRDCKRASPRQRGQYQRICFIRRYAVRFVASHSRRYTASHRQRFVKADFAKCKQGARRRYALRNKIQDLRRYRGRICR